MAAGAGHLDTVRALAEHGADANALSRRGCTPAMEAAEMSHQGGSQNTSCTTVPTPEHAAARADRRGVAGRRWCWRKG
jgi:ankyrin repeat protein